jgi:hypothetical protein
MSPPLSPHTIVTIIVTTIVTTTAITAVTPLPPQLLPLDRHITTHCNITVHHHDSTTVPITVTDF